MSIYQMSRAIAQYDSWYELERTLSTIEMLRDVKLDWSLIKSLWRDLQRTPKARAL